MSSLALKITFLISIFLVFGFIVLRNQGFGQVAYPNAALILEKKTFRATEDVVVTVDFHEEKDELSFGTLIGRAYAQSTDTITTEIIGPNKKKVEDVPTTINEKEKGVYEVRISPSQSNSIKPGKQTLKVTLKDGMARRTIEQDFSWGVLALNMNKAIYQPGETAQMAFAVLDETGSMVCDADVELHIRNQELGIDDELSINNGEIKKNPECKVKDYVEKPDYEADYQVGKVGTYVLELTARSRNGSHTIVDSFTVKESSPFVVERVAHTRIYPVKEYPVLLHITANQDFQGKITEIVPATYQVRSHEASDYDFNTQIRRKEEIKILTFDVSLKKGETKTLAYWYDAPNVSPQFHLLGPVSFKTTGGTEVYTDDRKWQIAVDALDATKIAWFKGTQLAGGGTDLNVGTKTALSWNSSQDYDSDYFSYSAGSPSRLTVTTAGDYLVDLTVPITSNGTVTNQRNGIEAEVRVNGVKEDVGIGASTYIRNTSGHLSSSAHLNVLLKDLSASDYVEVFVASTTTETTNVLTSDTHALYAEYVEDETVYAATATQTTNSTNLNQATPYEMEWSADTRKDTGYTHSTASSPEDITLDASGKYMVFVNIPTSGSITRGNVKGKILLDGSQIDGGIFQQGYIRNGQAHTDASIHWSGLVETGSSNQVLSVSVEQEAAAGTITVGGDKATIYIQKLPSTGIYQAEATQLTGGVDDWHPDSKTAIAWATDNTIDSSVFTHSTSTNNHQITVDEAGDYMLVFNAAFVLGTSLRPNPKVTVQVNGTDVTGLEAKSGYIRDNGGHDHSSDSLVGLLTGLSANDVITVSMQSGGTSGTVDDETPGTLLLWKKEGAVSSSTTEQSAYRFFANSNSTDVGSALAAQDTAAIRTTAEQEFRLRSLLHVGTSQIAQSGQGFKLQYVGKGGGTCASPSGGDPSTWSDVDIFSQSSVNSGLTGPGTLANDSSIGDDPWTNPGNAATSDNSYANFSPGSGSSDSYYLKTTNYSFSIPTNATIDGIEVEVERKRSGSGSNSDNAVRIIKNGSIGSTDRSEVSDWADSETTITYGSSSDLWGQTWSPSDINNSGFGFAMSVFHTGFNNADIDSIQIKVYYTLSSTDPIVFYNNTTPSDGATLTDNANDPSHSGHTNVNQTYEETNNFTNSVAAIPSGQDGLWDFSLIDNNAPSSTTYCFRIVKSDGSALDTYSVYPEITLNVPPPGPFRFEGLQMEGVQIN